MNKRDYVFAGLILICIGLVVWNKLTTPKIAYVRSALVLNDYLGMKEASKLNENKLSKWEANIDTLQLDFERAVNDYRQSFPKLTAKEKSEKESILRSQQEKLEEYKTTIQQKAQEEEEKATQGVLNQINSFIEDYSKKHGYDIVLGVTTSGNILYGTEATDITKEIIEGLNDSYKGK